MATQQYIFSMQSTKCCIFVYVEILWSHLEGQVRTAIASGHTVNVPVSLAYLFLPSLFVLPEILGF